ncbi:uncharacterized protein CCOS01_00240 [Colletotrichum costaricense]|uniref:Uncharacterized protein n=1 Tax=Colletotrichum costaricense TaxID=1209916 RepID=A0AAI9Z8J1_9PEZI|nr:uncharacterized protein CCOS01_00240 [Colletotrichum costaricense]KAK1538926.1 hypothetical protein CCOS01_00240 [Colletotrichum costaricense]
MRHARVPSVGYGYDVSTRASPVQLFEVASVLNSSVVLTPAGLKRIASVRMAVMLPKKHHACRERRAGVAVST